MKSLKNHLNEAIDKNENFDSAVHSHRQWKSLSKDWIIREGQFIKWENAKQVFNLITKIAEKQKIESGPYNEWFEELYKVLDSNNIISANYPKWRKELAKYLGY